MQAAPPRSPAECFATILLWLSRAVDGHSTWGRLSRPLGMLILNRIGSVTQRFARLAARIGAGTYVPRRSAPLRPPTTRRPRRPNPLPQGFAWLVKLVPEAAVYGSQLDYLFRDAEMAALMAAAPAPMRRTLRPLCHMLGVRPPPVLALPAAARPETCLPAPAQGAVPRAPRRTDRPSHPRYVFGLRYPPPFPDPP